MTPPSSNDTHTASEPRAVASVIVAEWLRNGTFPDRKLENYIGQGQAAVRELVYGAVKWRRSLEWRIARVTERPPRRNTAALLLVAASELFHMDDSPPYAVVNDFVAIARKRFSRSETGFVNAVLRNLIRDRPAADADLACASPAMRLSHPDCLWNRWNLRFGTDLSERLCVWNNCRAEVVIRPMLAMNDFDTFRASMRKAGLDLEPHPARPSECLLLPRGIRVNELPGFDQGAFTIQDPATLASVDLLAPGPGDLVLDACAAPGGKTAVIADRLAGRGKIVAIDIDRERVNRLIQNLERLRLWQATVLQADLTDMDHATLSALQRHGPAGFDAILLDVPCSNTGVLRRRPDARWRFDPGLLPELQQQQSDMLSKTAKLLKPGGRIVYSTCSLEEEENSRLIRAWLADNPGYRCDAETFLLPPNSNTDGAYAARLIRPA